MKKYRDFLKQWHIITVLLFVFSISVVMWLIFAITVFSYYSDNKEIMKNGFENVEKKEDSENSATEVSSVFKEIEDLLEKFDSNIIKINSQWSGSSNISLCKVDSYMSFFLFGEIMSDQVIRGDGKWLFYSSKTDGDPIGDFEGENIYTESEVNTIAESAAFVQGEMDKSGIRFAILVAPNKENIYAEFMPEKYLRADNSRTDILVNYLKRKGVNVLFPKDEMIYNRSDNQLYYYYDTHWNQLGAYIGVRETLMSWGISIPKLSERTIISKKLKDNYHYCGEDDLAKMVGLRSFFSDEIEFEIDNTISVDWNLFQTEQDNGKVSYFYNQKALNDRKLLLVGDSFRSSMVPTLCEQFTHVYVVHRSYYSYNILDEIKPDYVLAEYVERYSDAIRNAELFVGTKKINVS